MTEGRANHEKGNITGRSFQYKPQSQLWPQILTRILRKGWSRCILWDQRTKCVYSQWYSAVNSQLYPGISIAMVDQTIQNNSWSKFWLLVAAVTRKTIAVQSFDPRLQLWPESLWEWQSPVHRTKSSYYYKLLIQQKIPDSSLQGTVWWVWASYKHFSYWGGLTPLENEVL